jgi:endoglucanase
MRGVRVLGFLLLSSCVVLLGGGASAPAQSGDNPLAGLRFYVDQDSPSMEQYRALQRSGQSHQADLVWRIAREPKAVWVGRFTSPNFHVKVRRIFDSAHQQGEDGRTRAWYDDLARAIGNDRVVIAFEPDSLGTIDCHARSRRAARYRLLRYGVNALSQNPNATIYIEAGASDWEGASRMAKKLRRVGISKVRGFMLNATHYDWTRANVAYGLKLSKLVGGKHFIINTAENGRGPIHQRLPNGRRLTVWCNPPNRGLGPAPTTNTSNARVDAYLWVNRPGYAQSCQHRPIAWYLPRALSYAKFATSWEAPPPGTKNGFKVRR